MKKIKTIFEAIEKKADDNPNVEFNDYLYNYGEWTCTELTSNSFDNVIIIGKDTKYNYYLAWDNKDNGNLTLTYICRIKNGDC